MRANFAWFGNSETIFYTKQSILQYVLRNPALFLINFSFVLDFEPFTLGSLVQMQPIGY